MDEIDRAIDALHGVDTELDHEHVLNRTRAHYLGDVGSTVVIPLTETPRRTVGSRPRPAGVWVAAAVTAVAVCTSAVAASGLWRARPDVDGAGTPAAVAPSSSVTPQAAPSPTAIGPSADALSRAVSAATLETSCGEAQSQSSGRRYRLQLADGTWTPTSDDVAPGAGGEQLKVDELVLDALVRVLTHPDRYDTDTDGYPTDGLIEIDVLPADDLHLTGLVLLVDPVQWQPVTVIGHTASGAQSTIDTTWGHECPESATMTQ